VLAHVLAHAAALSLPRRRYMGVVDPKNDMKVGTVCHGMQYDCGAGAWGHALHEEECKCKFKSNNHIMFITIARAWHLLAHGALCVCSHVSEFAR
jgi:hypothetical protein